jgi:HPt (histidine-containing phosphotransfer) domain-containing protein
MDPVYHTWAVDKPEFNQLALSDGVMAYEAGALDATLAAAAGDDAQLFSELRLAFIESLARQVDLLDRARCDGNWQITAMRIKGLAASFHADPLLVLAEEALEAAPGDPVAVRRIKTFLDDYSAG